MESNKYLRIKTAVTSGTVDTNLIGSTITPDTTISTIPQNAQFSSPNIDKLNRIYYGLTHNNSAYVPATVLRNDDNTRDIVQWVSDKSRPYVAISDGASIFSYLHELGHVNDWDKNKNSRHIQDLYKIDYMNPDWPTRNSLGSMLGHNIYSSRAMRSTLKREREATQYVKDLLNTIQDPDVRARALKDAEEELNPSYNTYSSLYNSRLRYNDIGGALGGILGGALVGRGAYKLGKELADKYKLKGLKRLAATWGLGLGAGALGMYGGGYIGSTLGQIYFNKYRQAAADAANARYLSQALAAKAKLNKDENIKYLTDYLGITK